MSRCCIGTYKMKTSIVSPLSFPPHPPLFLPPSLSPSPSSLSHPLLSSLILLLSSLFLPPSLLSAPSLPFLLLSFSLLPKSQNILFPAQLTSSGLKSSAIGDASSREALNSFDDRFLFSLTVTPLRDLELSSFPPKLHYLTLCVYYF